MKPQVLELIGVEHDRDGQVEQTPTDDDGGHGASSAREGHCGLCSLTRDRDAWNAAGEELGVRLSLHTSDDLSPEESPVVREVGTPCVIARFDDNEFHAVVLAERLEIFEGDVTRLVREVRLVAQQQGWALPVNEDSEEQPETL